MNHDQEMEILWKRIKEFLSNRKFNYAINIQSEDESWIADFVVYDKMGKTKLLIDKTGGEIFSVPNGTGVIIYEDLSIEEVISDIYRLYSNTDYEKVVQDLLSKLPTDFPYPEYSIDEIKKDFEKLKTIPYKVGQKFGMKAVMYFHHSIWDASVGGTISPSEAWKDKSLLEKVIRNRIIYKPVLSPRNIARGFTISKIAMKVSVFNPSLAKHLVDTYASDSEVIIDPFAGFSGRMIGAAASGKNYYGLDINPKTIGECLALSKSLELQNTHLFIGDLLDVEDNGFGHPDAVCITCSPYNLKETWGMAIADKSCDEWIDEVMKRVVAKRYIFVVDKTTKYRNNVVECISNTSHFGTNTEFVIKIE